MINRTGDSDMPERILVTGGAGFIGSNLADSLLADGFEVTVLDNFSTGFAENLAEASLNARFKLVEGDIRSASDCRKAAEGCSVIFHEAALGSVPRSMKDPASTVDVNVTGFVNILKTAHEYGVRRVVYASSSAVYGDEPTLPKREERTGRCLSPYALSKHCNEDYAELFSRVCGLEITGLRYFNVFGRRQSPLGEYAAVIPRFINAVMNGESPVIYGDGSTSRDFTYIDNVVNANKLAMVSPVYGSAYNIACGSSVTLLELFEAVRSAVHSDVAPLFTSMRAGDIRHSLADITKAREELSYEVTVDFQEGIRRTVDFWRSLRSLKG